MILLAAHTSVSRTKTRRLVRSMKRDRLLMLIPKFSLLCIFGFRRGARSLSRILGVRKTTKARWYEKGVW